MRFWTFDFAFNQNEVVFNIKLKRINVGLSGLTTYSYNLYI